MAFIYKITSPSKRIYVGSTKYINTRFAAYRRLKCATQVRLYRSFKKYGVDKHRFEIITECSDLQMLQLEHYYGRLYNVLSKDHGLNCVLPKIDAVFNSRTEETREKIRNNLLGRVCSDATKEKMRKANLGKISPMKGKAFHTTESKLKLKIAHTGKKLSEEHKQNISKGLDGREPKNLAKIQQDHNILLLDINTGVFYESQKEVALLYNVCHGCIHKWMNGKTKNPRVKLIKC